MTARTPYVRGRRLGEPGPARTARRRCAPPASGRRCDPAPAAPARRAGRPRPPPRPRPRTPPRSGESSIATQSPGSTPRSAAAGRYGSGCGLPCVDLVPGDHRREGARRQRADEGVGQARATTSSPGRTARRRPTSAVEQLARAGPPRHVLAAPGATTPVEQLARRSRPACSGDVAVVRMYCAETTGRCRRAVRVLVGPDPAVPLDELALRRDPVGLGVDQRAVHVPQDGAGGRRRELSSASEGSGRVEVLRLGVVDDERVGRLLGVQLQLLGQLDADPLRLQQLDQLGAVLQVRAGRVAEGVARTAVALPQDPRPGRASSSAPKPSSSRTRACQYSASASVSCTDRPCSSR